MKYVIKFTPQANKDIRNITTYIKTKLYAPLTAKRFLRGIYTKITELETTADAYAISSYKEVLIYGKNARHINYKNFTIIYTIHNHIVLVHRMIHGTLIKK
ncbi:plasmid stabilization system protein ParE [Parabacteroides sp. PF5-5]|uniref:type II toxin-antitoxin system RelE/ParE family toxin n=1 Tax=unclassified Parabacteroides TaxID=2649774 RepID=UPI0024749DDD|nr:MULTISPECIES: type II toxin-antitoxin system RelE/ParE family toxin [unclassified Parabacteroides]MDH6304363.1 plasmid stabilization system protein ParE [Parabacteroides sp. PH5-39]MDH6315484.1 plasmid stabilization system protein ParE [Parabacteroides sp. PF5-13]MDH6319022.1 plasmid stabilization system protein ParE [Parabacteroides sp. PH5-13]MDH6322752.1 plasmid stabilization system protein ParE [Parabacteroides sp. PH5-8]MDH6326676.1 plasmid stabilization system protein ParE [Parabacter